MTYFLALTAVTAAAVAQLLLKKGLLVIGQLPHSLGDLGPFYMDVGDTSPVETEITTTVVGGGQTLVHEGRLYVTKPSGTQSTLTVVDLSDYSEVPGSPFDVGSNGDGIKGMAVY